MRQIYPFCVCSWKWKIYAKWVSVPWRIKPFELSHWKRVPVNTELKIFFLSREFLMRKSGCGVKRNDDLICFTLVFWKKPQLVSIHESGSPSRHQSRRPSCFILTWSRSSLNPGRCWTIFHPLEICGCTILFSKLEMYNKIFRNGPLR